eukprot:1090056-Amphidinium_carterae.1
MGGSCLGTPRKRHGSAATVGTDPMLSYRASMLNGMNSLMAAGLIALVTQLELLLKWFFNRLAEQSGSSKGQSVVAQPS